VFKEKQAMKQLSLMLILTILTQIFMLLKNTIVAATFGVSAELDAFNFASSISGFVYSFIGSGISTILIPNLAYKEKQKAINVFITILYTFALAVFFIMLIFREDLIILLSGSNDNSFIKISSNIFIATLIAGFLNSLLGLVNGVLQFHGKFNRLKLVTLFTSILLFFILFFGTNMNIYYYAIAILITTLLNITIHLFLLIRSQFKYKICFDINDKDFKKLIVLFFPIVFSEGVYQISLIIDTMIASRLGIGQVSILNYSNTVIGMLNVLFLANITAFLYPKLINESKDNYSQGKLINYIVLINTIMCLLVALFVVLGKEGVSILYERGKFTTEDTKIVYFCALIYIMSLPTNGIRDLIYKYFYINNDTYTPFKNSILISLLNILISILLSLYIGIYGVILGTVIASYLSLAFIIIRFKKKFGFNFDFINILIENVKVVIITVITVLLSSFIKNLFEISNLFLTITIYASITLLLYTLLLYLSKNRFLSLNKKSKGLNL